MPYLFLVLLLSTHALAAGAADARLALPMRGVRPELLALALVAAAALALVYIGLRRGLNHEERARALQQQLAAERESHARTDQSLAEHCELLCKLVRQQEGVREAERCRIARSLEAQLGGPLAGLRAELRQLQDGLAAQAPGATQCLESALAQLDAAIEAMHAVAGKPALAEALPGLGPPRDSLPGLSRATAPAESEPA